ncbi:MAG: hypothetical protein ABS46_15710 [Cytophagaceae bacterium SCN 52-12]|nr:MAG: hypothetical protein ABS46_15710 [Cytophagaceae bacterium SCN 52-12]
MSHSTFTDLLKKYQLGTATESERKVVEQWYALIEEEPRILDPEEWNTVEERLWQKLAEKTGRPADPARVAAVPRPQKLTRYVVAATFLLAAMLLGFLLLRYPGEKAPADTGAIAGLKSVRNTDEKEISVLLEDSSTVLLAPGSELSYPEHFRSDSREVYLSGEAFFVIARQAGRPFFVNAGKITTKVLGTSFRVKSSHDGAEIEVSVRTGKVSVYEKARKNNGRPDKTGNSIILTPNQQVTFREENGAFITGLVENPEILPEATRQHPVLFDYRDTELSKVLADLKKAYLIDLELEKKSLGDCPLTANLGGKDLFVQLDLICAAIQGSYQIQGTTILISGRGCE